jgi:hypothetical protein
MTGIGEPSRPLACPGKGRAPHPRAGITAPVPPRESEHVSGKGGNRIGVTPTNARPLQWFPLRRAPGSPNSREGLNLACPVRSASRQARRRLACCLGAEIHEGKGPGLVWAFPTQSLRLKHRRCPVRVTGVLGRTGPGLRCGGKRKCQKTYEHHCFHYAAPCG